MKLATALILIFNASITSAAYTMKPGLWESSFTIKSESGKIEDGMNKMQAEMAKMPDEQRKMIEGIMSNKNVSVGAGKPTSVKICISKEQADDLEIPQKETGSCTHKVVKRTAYSTKIKFSCTGEPVTNGESEFTLISPTTYTGKTIVNNFSQGKTERMDMNQKGKWLSVDCGNIKPITKKN